MGRRSTTKCSDGEEDQQQLPTWCSDREEDQQQATKTTTAAASSFNNEYY